LARTAPTRRVRAAEGHRSGGAYRRDLAAIHDAGFPDLAAHAALVLIGALRRSGLVSGLVVDLGCGGGVLAERVAGAGYDALGVDISPALVALARRRVPAAHFVVGSWLDAGLPACAGVAAVGECLNYLFDPRNTGAARRDLFGRVYGALPRGGVFLFDIAGPGRVPRECGTQTSAHRVEEDWAVLMTAREDRRRRLLERRITTFRRVGDLYRRSHEVHRLRLLAPGRVRAELEATGFAVRLLAGYGRLRFPPGLCGILARKT
jgi:SAM-dependent methyltransferase